MRILFTTFPGYGHLHPMVPLAMAAVDRGDDVLVASGPEFGDWVAACGLRATRGGLDLDELLARSRARFPGPVSTAHMFSTVAVPAMVADLVELCARWRPDLIIHEEAEYGGPLVAAVVGVPCVTHSWAAPARPEVEQTLFRTLMEPIWTQHRAGPVRLRGDVYLDACPPPFQTEDIAGVDEVRPIRPVAFDGPPTSTPDPHSDLGRPAAYVTLGTVSEFSQIEVLQRAMVTAAREVTSVVVTTGPNPANGLMPPSPSVFVYKSLPQSKVLQNVDLVVSHGGAGTTLGALQHGLPHVVIPQGAKSQQRNAERVDALGIGIHVHDIDDLTVLSAAIHDAVTTPSYAHEAAHIGETLAHLPAPASVLAQLLTDFG